MIHNSVLDQLLDADQIGLRLEIVGGLSIWEAHPLPKHQRAVDRIRASIVQPPMARRRDGGCGCVHLADVYVQFPDGSLKRPDISIFCEEPPEEEEAIRRVPEAVVEVISRGYEAKDLEIGPRFYLSQGVKDVVVFDPYTLVVLHVFVDGAERHVSPVTLVLACGCRCTV
jgi:Uma2 family endonuclease